MLTALLKGKPLPTVLFGCAIFLEIAVHLLLRNIFTEIVDY